MADADLADIFQRYLAAGLYSHAYCAYGRLAETLPEVSYEHLPDGRSVFDLASLTKALVTTPLVFAAAERGELELDWTLGRWLGAAAAGFGSALLGLTIRQILRHDTGLPAWRNWWVCKLGVAADASLAAPEERRARLLTGLNRAAAEIDPKRASTPLYSDVGFLLLGLALETAYGTGLERQFDGFCRNLNLDAGTLPLAFGPDLAASIVERAVPTGFCAVRNRALVGEVHDENCASLGGIAGHAGLFGTGPAVARFLHALSACACGQALLAANAAARRLPVCDPPNESLVGWRQAADPSSRPFGDGSAMGHMGFTGVAFWVCPDRRDYAILLTNRVFGGRLRPGIAAMRREVFTALAARRR